MIKKTKKERLVYIGPTLSKGRLFHGTVFIGGYPAQVKQLCLEHPWFDNLFVPVADFAASCREAAKKGTPLSIFMKKAREV